MSTAAISPTPDAPLSQAERVVDTFFAPSKTFNDIKRSQSWWVPWLLASLITTAFWFTVGQKIGFEEITRTQIANSSRAAQFEKLPPEQQERQIEISTKIYQYITYLGPIVGLIFAIIMAAILMGTFNFGLGAEIPFKGALAVVMYGGLPMALGSILGIISLLAGLKPEGFNAQNPVATNPAYFMDLSGNKFLYSMCSALDVLVIWSIILMGMGFSAQSKVKKGTAIGVIAGLYLVWKVITGGLASM